MYALGYFGICVFNATEKQLQFSIGQIKTSNQGPLKGALLKHNSFWPAFSRARMKIKWINGSEEAAQKCEESEKLKGGRRERQGNAPQRH